MYADVKFGVVDETALQVPDSCLTVSRVKLGIFGQTAKFGQPLCLLHSSIIDLKYKLLSKQ